MSECLSISRALCTADRLQSVLQWLGISVSELSPLSQGYIQSLSASAAVLGISDCSDTR